MGLCCLSRVREVIKGKVRVRTDKVYNEYEEP